MSFFLFLFSSGQDSLFFLFIKLIYGINSSLFLLILNHQMQINGTRFTLHSCRISIFFKEIQVISILDHSTHVEEVLNEERLRFIRYNLQLQVAKFYKINYLGTGHTSADLYETILLDLLFNSIFSFKTSIKFKNKLLMSKRYPQRPYLITSFLSDSPHFYQKKQNYRFLFSSSFKQKNISILTRPLKNFTRTAVKTFDEKHCLPIFIDSTNFTILITRNQIRRYSLIYLQKLIKTNNGCGFE